MMRAFGLVLAVLALVLQDPAAEGKRWWSHVEFLASDALEGRDVGTPGFEKAAGYVEQQFRDMGLKPGGVTGYRQPVSFEKRTLVPDQSALTLVRDGEELPLVFGKDATLSARGERDGTFEAALVFAGYGLSIPEANWDDLEGLDLRGKIAVVVTTPVPADVSDNVRSHVGSFGERWAALRKAGAIGVAAIGNLAPPGGAATARPAGAAPPPATVVLADPDLQDTAGLALAVTLTRSGLDTLLAGSGHPGDELAQLVADRKPLPRFPLAGRLRAEVALRREPLESANVIGIYEGADPSLKSEYVVMSAHLDHVGIGREVDGDRIYNGAMDDASGVASVIEIARMMTASGARPKRSVLFMAQTAEEKGLLGSRYFAAHPTVPFESIVADINLDMFLPLYPLKVIEVQGLAESSLGEAVRAAAKELGVDVQTDRQPEENRFIRSDQYSFIRRGIPALAFKFGYDFGSAEEKTRLDWVRDVYHKPNDDLRQPVDLEAAATFNRVILGLLRRVANDPARPAWNDDSFFRRFAK
jgi:Zn-dependent M28 family amino/carboxypeptidase